MNSQKPILESHDLGFPMESTHDPGSPASPYDFVLDQPQMDTPIEPNVQHFNFNPFNLPILSSPPLPSLQNFVLNWSPMSVAINQLRVQSMLNSIPLNPISDLDPLTALARMYESIIPTNLLAPESRDQETQTSAHVQVEQLESKKPPKIPCPQCPKQLCNKGHLYYHLRTAHGAVYNPYQCPHCSKAFAFKTLLNHHLPTHTKRFICQVCDKAFSQFGNLKSHVRTHLKVKPYRCTWPACYYAYKDCATVVKHVRVKHFHLPPTKQKQLAAKIVDTRDPRKYIEKMDEELHEGCIVWNQLESH